MAPYKSHSEQRGGLIARATTIFGSRRYKRWEARIAFGIPGGSLCFNVCNALLWLFCAGRLVLWLCTDTPILSQCIPAYRSKQDHSLSSQDVILKTTNHTSAYAPHRNFLVVANYWRWLRWFALSNSSYCMNNSNYSHYDDAFALIMPSRPED